MAELLAKHQVSPHARFNGKVGHKPFVFGRNLHRDNQGVLRSNLENHANHDASMTKNLSSGSQEVTHANIDSDADHESITTGSDVSNSVVSLIESPTNYIGESVLSSMQLKDAACTPPVIEEGGQSAAPEDTDQLGGQPSTCSINVCLRCRGRKSRCSGQRPTSDACSNSNKRCSWVVLGNEPTAMQRRKPRTKVRPEAHPTAKKYLSQVRSACTRCQKRKAKCSGERPSCQYCSDRDFDCTYTVPDGVTRTEDLKRKLSESLARSQDLDQFIEALRWLPIQQSTALLARLRLGDPIESIFATVHAMSS